MLTGTGAHAVGLCTKWACLILDTALGSGSAATQRSPLLCLCCWGSRANHMTVGCSSKKSVSGRDSPRVYVCGKDQGQQGAQLQGPCQL